MTTWNQLTNERGAAFLLALLVTGFVMIFATFLLGLSQNANQQAHKVSDREAARLMAEAGIDYYDAQLSEAATGQTDVQDIVLPEPISHDLDSRHAFTIERTDARVSGDALTVTYTSTGEADGELVRLDHQTTITP